MTRKILKFVTFRKAGILKIYYKLIRWITDTQSRGGGPLIVKIILYGGLFDKKTL